MKTNGICLSLVNDSKTTLETDDSDIFETRTSSRSHTISTLPSDFSQIVVTSRQNSVRKKKFLKEKLRTERDGESSEAFLETIKKDDATYHFIKLMVIELEEECSHHWVPEPAFVHQNSMDFQTPRVSFTPTKPIRRF